jgi:hypothetical protein
LYWSYAVPITTSGFAKTGTRRFAISEDGVLRHDANLIAPANEAEVRLMSPSGN